MNSMDDLAVIGEPLHLALGVFDGVHIGHQAVIARAVDAARREGGLPGVLTFDPHPIRVCAPGKAPAALLETLEHKGQIVAALGVRLFVPLKFDANFAAIEAQEFIARLTAAPVRTLCVGEDWRFGHQRGGDVALLRQQAGRRGFQLEAVPPVMLDGERVSSTRVRQAIRDGNLAAAARMLGRPYAVSGIVTAGDQRGRTLDFPTANVATGELQLPPDGVWAVWARTADGRAHAAVANLGLRPTIGGKRRLLEAHLLDFAADLYGQRLEVTFVQHLRAELRFPSLDALREQIARDARAAREVLGRAGKPA